MHTFIKNFRGLPLIFAFISIYTMAGAQAEKPIKKDNKTASLINSKTFAFIAQSVLPMSGPTRQLTSEYSLKIAPDKIDAYLPFFGRAFVAPIDPKDAGIQFVSSQFDYRQTARKKGGWEIVIRPKDARDVRQLLLTISSSGFSFLQVISNNKETISYNGYIQSIETSKS